MENIQQRYDAFYGRVSGDEQEFNTSLGFQLDICRQLALRDSGEIFDEFCFTDVYSGRYLKPREGMMALLAAIRVGKIRRLYFFTSCRLSRKADHFRYIRTECELANVQLITAQATFYPDGLAGDIMEVVDGYEGEKEYQKLVLRTQTGKRARAQAGYQIPPGKRKYGYQPIDVIDPHIIDPKTGKQKVWKKGHNIVVEEEARIIRWIFKKYIQGRGYARIATILNRVHIPTPSSGDFWKEDTVRRIIKSRCYTGEAEAYYYQCTRYEYDQGYRLRIREKDSRIPLPSDVFPQIISGETFEAAQEATKQHKVPSRGETHQAFDYLLRNGFVRCGHCGSPMYASTTIDMSSSTPHERPRYTCMRKRNTRLFTCPTNNINAKRADRDAWAFLESQIEDHKIIRQAIEAWKLTDNEQDYIKGIEATRRNIAIRQAEISEELDLRDHYGRRYFTPTNPRYLALLEESRRLDTEDQSWIKELEEMRQKIAFSNEMETLYLQFEGDCQQIQSYYKTASSQQKRDILLFFGLIVTVYRADDTTHPGRLEFSLAPRCFTVQPTRC